MKGASVLRLEAIVLAAGAASRFGSPKLLAPWRGGVLLDGAVGAALASPVRCVHVVWGADPQVASAASGCAARLGQGGRLQLVHAPRFAEGLSASLAAGVEAVSPDTEGAFVFLGDMPRVPQALAAPMADALKARDHAVAPTFGGRRGHPVLFGAALLPSLLGLAGDRGAGALLGGLGERLVLVPSPDDGVLFDVDSLGDLPTAG